MAALLPQCLDSLTATQEVAEQLDVVVVNDGSRDGSLAVAQSYAERFPQSVRVIDKPNGNYGSTINAALPTLQGEYVKVLDADDKFDAESLAQYHKGDDNHHNANGIGHSKAHRNSRIIDSRKVDVGLLCSTHSRGICHCTIHHSDHSLEGCIGSEVEEVGHHSTECHSQYREPHLSQTALAQRREEGGANLQTHRKDEERQTEVTHEVEGVGVEGHSEVACHDTSKEYPSSTERDTSDLDFGQQRAYGDNECQHKYRVGYALPKNEVFDKFHNPNCETQGQR